MKQMYEKSVVIINASLILLLSVLFFALEDKLFSDKENRTLQAVPSFTLQKLADGDYAKQTAKYLADQFPFRDTFVCLKAYSELTLAKRENNGIIYGKDGVLVPRVSIENDILQQNINHINDFSQKTGKQVFVAPLPAVIDVTSEYLPKNYTTDSTEQIWQKLDANIGKAQAQILDLREPLNQDGTYYKTDHHYTTKGAYITYCALSEKLGFVPKDESFFNVETATSDFCGTSMRSSGFYLADKDTIHLYRYENDESFSVVADGKTASLYDFDKLNTTDKYAVFLGGNHARVDITSGAGDREKLLVIRDSFADSIAPFLALHYDLILVDLRYYTDSLSQLVAQEGIDKVLVLENITELATAKNISILQKP